MKGRFEIEGWIGVATTSALAITIGGPFCYFFATQVLRPALGSCLEGRDVISDAHSRETIHDGAGDQGDGSNEQRDL
jgi:hypothetical protein